MRVSVVTLIRDSQQMMNRQVLYMNSLNLPSDIEVVFVDHANTPQVSFEEKPEFEAFIVRYQDRTPWIIPTLMNFARQYCHGKYIMKLDVDVMLSKAWVDYALKSDDDYAEFKKIEAFLDEKGNLKEAVRITKNVFHNICWAGGPGISWSSTEVFDRLEGWDTRYDGLGFGCDLDYKRRYLQLVLNEGFKVPSTGPDIYMLPEKPSKKRPYELLHTELKRGEFASKR